MYCPSLRSGQYCHPRTEYFPLLPAQSCNNIYFRLKYGDMHHICQFSLCRLQVESRAIGREVQAWFQVLKKKVSFSVISSFQLPLRVLLRVKLGATKRMNSRFVAYTMLILLQQGCNNPVVTVSITRLNTRLLQPCFMVVTTLNYNLVTTLLHPCNKVVISVWGVPGGWRFNNSFNNSSKLRIHA